MAKTQTRVLSGSLWLGAHEVANPAVSVGTKSSLIGIPIIRQFRVVIDQAGKTIAFQNRLLPGESQVLPSSQPEDRAMKRRVTGLDERE